MHLLVIRDGRKKRSTFVSLTRPALSGRMKGNLEDAFAVSSDQRVYTVQRNYSPNLEWLSYEMQGKRKRRRVGMG